jgi:hypothetical protein
MPGKRQTGMSVLLNKDRQECLEEEDGQECLSYWGSFNACSDVHSKDLAPEGLCSKSRAEEMPLSLNTIPAPVR